MPTQGETRTWWTITHNCGLLQHRATYHQNTPCIDVTGRMGLAYIDDWYIEQRYVPEDGDRIGAWSGSGRCKTADLDHDIQEPTFTSRRYPTFDRARAAALAAIEVNLGRLSREIDTHKRLADRLVAIADPEAV